MNVSFPPRASVRFQGSPQPPQQEWPEEGPDAPETGDPFLTTARPSSEGADAPRRPGRVRRALTALMAAVAVGGAGGAGGYYVGNQGQDTLELQNRQLSDENSSLTSERDGLVSARQALEKEKQELEQRLKTSDTDREKAERRIKELEKLIQQLNPGPSTINPGGGQTTPDQSTPGSEEGQVAPGQTAPGTQGGQNGPGQSTPDAPQGQTGPANTHPTGGTAQAGPGQMAPGFDAANYRPTEVRAFIQGEALANNAEARNDTGKAPLGLLHETVGSYDSANKRFDDPASGVSTHLIIGRDGTSAWKVSGDMAAHGAGQSAFQGESDPYDGSESVNNFAFQLEIVSPEEGYGSKEREDAPEHSGYTEEQYQAAAFFMAKAGIPLERITTHKAVALPEGRKKDPRSFDMEKFTAYYNAFREAQPEVAIDLGLRAQAR